MPRSFKYTPKGDNGKKPIKEPWLVAAPCSAHACWQTWFNLCYRNMGGEGKETGSHRPECLTARPGRADADTTVGTQSSISACQLSDLY